MKCIYFTNLDFNRMPFDWKNPTGFLVAVIIQYIFDVITLSVSAWSAALNIGAVLFIFTLIKDIRRSLKPINDNAKSTTRKRQAMQQLSDYIQLHSNVKQLSKMVPKPKGKPIIVFERIISSNQAAFFSIPKFLRNKFCFFSPID